MERKNTMLLTVIAVATLLVAIVGATFAYFTASVTNADATEVVVTTEALSSTVATGSDSLILDITAEDMVQAEDDVILTSETPAVLDIETTNGSTTSSMTCTYDIVYTAITEYTKTPDMDLEFYLSFNGLTTGVATDVNEEISNYDMENGSTTIASNLSYTVPVAASNTEAAIGGVEWTVDVNFVNSATVVQDVQAAKEFQGKITIENLDCVVNSEE